jgi:hypothetical protein
MNTLVVICYILNAGVFIFAFTRPSAAWLAAGRNRAFWLTLLAVCGFLAVPGVVADVAFFVGVLPRMLSGTAAAVDDPRVRPNPFIKK